MGIEYFVKEIGDNFLKGAKEFSRNPIKYSAKAVGEFVGDYWDVAGAVAASYALADIGGQNLGDLRGSVFRTGAVLSVAGPFIESVLYSNTDNGTERFIRNFAAGATSFLYFGGLGNIPKAGSLITGGITLLLNKEFKHNKKYRTVPKIEVPENQVNKQIL